MISPFKKLANNLKRYQLTISVAESCTGGLLAKSLTDIPGSSSYFIGGVVTYSNESKIKILSVNEDTIKRFGAVSKETAKEMAVGLSRIFQTEIAVSITGIAGPDGGSKDKPVGTVFFCLIIKGQICLYRKLFRGSRAQIRRECVKFIVNEINRKLGG